MLHQYRGRTRALAVVLALLASMLSMSPARAETTQACPSTLPSTNFTDLSGLSGDAKDAIRCVTYYGIAKGTSATRFSPADEVSRWQMALFLIRTAEDLGIVLPSGTPQGFTDIGILPADAQKAINQLAQLAITKGVTPNTFAPTEGVPRWQMALFLTRLYARAGFPLPSGVHQGFNDLSSYPLETQVAINQLVQLDIAKGTSTTTYTPAALVSRWQMALFLARQLEAAKASPYRISMEPTPAASPVSGTVDLKIRVVTAEGLPVANRYVDVFVGAFAADGKCVLDANAKLNGGDAATSTNCRIDTSDPKTNSAGEVTVKLTHTAVLETDTIVAWIGEVGETFDADVVRTRAMVQVVWSVPVAGLAMPGVVALFGTQAQVTARLVDASGKAVAMPGQRIVFVVSRASTPILSKALVTGADGSATLSYLGPSDPTLGDDPAIVDTVVAFWDKDGDGVDDGAAEFDVAATVTWDDAGVAADKATLTQTQLVTLAGQTVSVQISVTDKFGKAIKDAKVNWKVTGANPGNGTATTGTSGTASFSYTGASSGVDTIDAEVDIGNNGSIDLGFDVVADLLHYVVAPAPDLTDGEHTFDLIAVDLAANTLDVVDLGTNQYLRLKYDTSNDYFSVDGKAKDIDGFEAALAALSLPDLVGLPELKTNTYSTTTSASSTFILKTK